MTAEMNYTDLLIIAKYSAGILGPLAEQYVLPHHNTSQELAWAQNVQDLNVI